MAKSSKAGTRFVNRTGDVLHVSTPRGSRLALAPGQFVTDEYYRRFVKKPNERRATGKFLIEEYPDGTPVGESSIEPVATVQAAPYRETPQPSIATPPPGGCETSCEAACEFPSEASSDNVASVNAGMDKRPPGTKPEPPAPVTPPAPPAPALPDPIVPKPATPPGPPSPPAPPAPPAPPVVDPSNVKPRLTPPEIVTALGITEQDVLDVNDGWLKVMLAGKETYVSRFNIEFRTATLASIKRHAKDMAPGFEQ